MFELKAEISVLNILFNKLYTGGKKAYNIQLFILFVFRYAIKLRLLRAYLKSNRDCLRRSL